jgi:AcrR family transcriptional regulator
MRITDQNILDAALKVFSTEGYAGATTRKIAQEANVTEVTLFRKFQSKENLMKEVLNKNRNSILPIKRSLKINKDADIERDLCFFGNEISKNMEEEQKDSTKQMFMLMLFEEGRRRPELANILISVFQNDIEQISEYFEQQIKY